MYEILHIKNIWAQYTKVRGGSLYNFYISLHL